MSIAEQQDFMDVSLAFEGGKGSVRDFFQLLKPRVMSLVVFTALVGIILAPDGMHPVLSFVSIMCIAIGAGASGALNMWYDADVDAVMSRTRNRPIPSGAVTSSEALTFGIVLSGASVFVLGIAANWLAACFLAFTIFFYAVVYTMWLKRRTQQNIVIGGAAGAFPPMIGWMAVTGSISVEGLILFMIIFVWTPPHFWALALIKSEDYRSAGIPMMPVVSGIDATRNQILLYSLLLLPIGVSPYVFGFAGVFYGIVSLVSGLMFAGFAFDVWRKRQEQALKQVSIRLFSFSILHLFLLFAVLLGERLIS